MNEEKLIKLDRMRFTKNTASSRLALLAIVFDVLYFVSVYKVNQEFYYQYLIGVSIIYNLVFLLMAFLCSEGVKNYKPSYSLLLTALGIGQVVRIFILPAQAHAATYKKAAEVLPVMDNGQYAFCIACLIISALCCIASAIINVIKSRQLARHIATLDIQPA